MIYKMTLTDSSDTMTFNLLEAPIVDKDIEGAVDNVTLDGNQYTDYLYLKKQYIQKWAIMCPDEYDQLRGFYTRQFEDGEVPSYRLYYGANVTRNYTLNGDYFQFNAEGIETGMTLSQLLGNAEQTGAPTPDSPQPVSTVTGAQTVVICGENTLSAPQDYTEDKNGLVFTCTGGIYNIRGNASSGNVTADHDITQPYTIREGDYWHLCNDFTDTHIQIALVFTDGSIRNHSPSVVNRIESLSAYAGKTVSKIRFYYNSGYNINGNIKPMILNGVSTATGFIPYQGQSYAIDLGSIELAKLGDYQDYIWKDNDTWKLHKATAVAVLNGTENWAESGSTHERFVIGSAQTTFSLLAIGTPSYKSKCDYFTFQESGTAWTGIGKCGFDSLGTFWCMISGMSSLADFKTWLGTNNVRVYYPLATPTTTEITDETLIAQLNFLASLYEGVNNISLVGTGAQGEMEVFIRDVISKETDVVPEVPVRLTLTDDGVINACGCRRNVQLTMRETTE